MDTNPAATEIAPALTPEEWAEAFGRAPWQEPDDYGDEHALLHKLSMAADGVGGFANPRHAAAALALHGQPFGFTREDLALLEEAASDSDYADQESRVHGSPDNTVPERLARLAARIAALLPPE